MKLNAAQQGLLQLAENTILAALITALLAITPYLQGDGPIQWGHVLNTFGLTFFFAVVHALVATVKAWNAPLGTVLETDITAVQAHLSQDGSKGPVTPPTPTQPPLQGSQGPLVVIHTGTPPPVQSTPIASTQAVAPVSTSALANAPLTVIVPAVANPGTAVGQTQQDGKEDTTPLVAYTLQKAQTRPVQAQ